MNISGHVFVVVLLVLCGCPKPEPPLDPSDPGATCASACSNARSLKCDDFATTPRGATCEDVCVGAHRNAATEWPVGCMTHASSCLAVAACR